jgi:hypothetical protein
MYVCKIKNNTFLFPSNANVTKIVIYYFLEFNYFLFPSNINVTEGFIYYF